MIQEWNIRPRAPACDGCKIAFEDGQVCYSGIETVETEWVRRDFCAECWQQYRQAHPAFGAWRGRFHAPSLKKAEEPVKRETAETLLRRLLDEDADGNREVLFVLAVMLERKKILVERDVQVQPDGERCRLYEHRQNGELLRIPDPQLRLDALQPVQEAVMHLLSGTQPVSDPAPASA